MLLEKDGRKLLEIITKTCSTPLIALYDPILFNDVFGQEMERNLTRAGLLDTSTCLHHLPTLDSHLDRLTQCGFDVATGCDMAAAYDTILTYEQRMRANKCEMLDEFEEWMLIMRHYCFIVVGRSLDGTFGSDNDIVKSFC